VQFRFRHRSFQPQQQAVIELGRIIDPIGVGNKRIEQRADLQKLMPIAARSGQPRHLNPENQPDIAEADFRHQSLKTKPPLDAGTGTAQIVIDHDNSLPRPAEMERPIDQRILQPCRFLVTLDLLNRGLTDVNNCQTFTMAAKDLLGHARKRPWHEIPVCHHRLSP
jgi:hypothetical protein